MERWHIYLWKFEQKKLIASFFDLVKELKPKSYIFKDRYFTILSFIQKFKKKVYL